MRSALLALLLLAGSAAGNDETKVDFTRDIRPILANNCLLCHGPDDKVRKGDLRLDTREGALADLAGKFAIVPGKPAKSELLSRVTSKDRDEVMPPPKAGKKLSPREVDLLKRWIEQGAPYQRHWAFVKPAPGSADIDRHILARLEAEKLGFAPEADRATLIRRLSLDMTGLPPTLEEADGFLKDTDPNAYEKLVDRLIASPAYGERWAKLWLDLARYADSQGYAEDRPRVIWAWRDWLISALNRNLPYDQFSLQILAGDLLPNATEDQVHATAFHRNTLTNTEGGTDDEEFRNAAIVDRVNTVMQTWMGLTSACAQCHNHKYDPFSQEEFFKIFAFFNQSEDSDRGDDFPTVPIWTDEQKQRRQTLEADVVRLEAELAKDTPALVAARAKWVAAFAVPLVWKDSVKTATALKIEAPGDLSKLTIGLKHGPAAAASARIVRIELPGKGKYLSLAEVEVFAAGENVARKGKAKQSATAFDGPPALAIDGNTNGDHAAKSVTHTDGGDDPWWEVDLGKVAAVERIVIWNRTDGGEGVSARLKDFRVKLLDEKRKTVEERSFADFPNPKTEWRMDGMKDLALAGRYVPAAGSVWVALEKPLTLEAGAVLVSRPEGKITLSDDVLAPSFIRTPADVRAALSKGAGEDPKVVAWHRQTAPETAASRDALAVVKKALADLKPAGTLPVMKELAKERRRKTQIQERGNFLIKGKVVTEGVPAEFPPLPKDAPSNRLGFALWMVSPENPLTARVAVNRYWEQLFGTGLMATSEDWGLRGEWPSHPELLDALAADFQKNGWDVKRLLKQLVMTRTYRQSSQVRPEQIAKDPGNRLLGRGPRQRLLAEVVRDQALSVSGLLSRKLGGPSVYPPQPKLGLAAAFSTSTDWEASKGEDRYRRGLYTFWRRSVTYPSMATFDAPDRNVCTVRRIPTNTPLQALVTMNDPVYVESAQALARLLVTQGGKTAEERAAWGFRRCLTRPPTAAETARLVKLHAEMKARYEKDPAKAKLLATDPLGPLPAGMEAADLAAWTVVCNVLLNLDELFMKR